MDDATRKAIEALIAPYPRDSGDPHVEALERLLAREAEYDQLVTPEWLDGEEAKRLGFAKATHGWWETPCVEGAGDLSVRLEPACIVVRDETGHSACFCGDPTIAQVRAAVELATGRR